MGALDLFLDLAALSTPPGEERAVADRVIAELRAPRPRRRRGRRGRRGRREHREPLLPPRADRGRHAALPLRAHGHGPAGRADRAGGRGRRRPQRGRDDPRRRQQVGGRGDGRGGPARRGGAASRTPGSSSSSHRRRRSDCAARRRSTARGSSRASATSTTRPGPIGEVILGAPHSSIMQVTFIGQAAHAGMAPEDGRSAIAAAARAIADMRLGRLDEETSANVGTIDGGVARNIVPDRCTFQRARRARTTSAKLADVVQEMLDACAFAAIADRLRGRGEGRAAASRATASASEDEPVRLARAALERTGHEPVYSLSGGGADANVFNMRGLACVNLANGMAEIHSPAGAHRRRRPRGHGRRHARAARGGACRLASGAARSPRCSERHEGLVRARGGRRAVRRLPAADRAGRARRRGARQHAGARARARLGRVRRPLREPDARSRARGGGRART